MKITIFKALYDENICIRSYEETFEINETEGFNYIASMIISIISTASFCSTPIEKVVITSRNEELLGMVDSYYQNKMHSDVRIYTQVE